MAFVRSATIMYGKQSLYALLELEYGSLSH